MAGQHDDRRLETVLAQDAHSLAPVDVGQAHVHDHEIDLAGLGGLHAFGSVLGRDRLEFLMQGELLDQGVAQFGVVVDNQNLSDIRHRAGPSEARAGPVQHPRERIADS